VDVLSQVTSRGEEVGLGMIMCTRKEYRRFVTMQWPCTSDKVTHSLTHSAAQTDDLISFQLLRDKLAGLRFVSYYVLVS